MLVTVPPDESPDDDMASWEEWIARAMVLSKQEGLLALVGKVVERVSHRFWAVWPLRRLALHRVTDRLSRLQAAEQGIDDILDTAYGFSGYGPFRPIEPSQVRWELKKLTELVRSRTPRSLIEIGTKQGGTLYVWLRAFPNVQEAISVDLPGGPFGGGYHEWEAELFRKFSESVRLYCLRMNSHNDACEERVATLSPPRGVDFLFIDGDHSYRGVREDFERYRKYMAEDGIIALHDIVPHPPQSGCEVHRFWKDLQESSYRTEEIVRDRDQGWAGIGVVHL